MAAGLVVGLTAGVIIVAILVGLVLWYFIIKRKTMSKSTERSDEEKLGQGKNTSESDDSQYTAANQRIADGDSALLSKLSPLDTMYGIASLPVKQTASCLDTKEGEEETRPSRKNKPTSKRKIKGQSNKMKKAKSKSPSKSTALSPLADTFFDVKSQSPVRHAPAAYSDIGSRSGTSTAPL